MSTFEDVWRRCRLELPAVPPLLLRAWAQDAYNDLGDRWGWSFLRAESTIVTKDARAFDVTFTQDAAGITSAALFVASDAGRQIKISGSPLYTIITVTDTSNAVLERAFTESTITGAATILDAYVTMPADFRRFLVVLDRYNQRAIPFTLSEDQIAVADPARLFTDSTLRYLVARKYSAATATLGQVQYELWPGASSARTYPFLYIRAAESLVETTPLPGVLFTRPDVLRYYMLSRGALWPGTVDQKNPAYNPTVAQLWETKYETEVQRLTLVDDSEYPQQYQQVHWDRQGGGLAPTAGLLRSTDATVADYY